MIFFVVFFVSDPNPLSNFRRGFIGSMFISVRLESMALVVVLEYFFFGVIGVLAAQVGEGMVRVWPSGASGSGFAGDGTC